MQPPKSASSPAVRLGPFDRLRSLLTSKWLMSAITLVLFVLAVMAIYRLLHEIQPQQLWDELRSVSPTSLLLSLLFMVLSFVFMVGYDASALHYIGKKLPWRTISLASFIGYAFSNTLGMALVSGATVRYRIYVQAGLDAMDVARVAAFCAIAYGIGAHVVAALGLAWYPELLAEWLSLPPVALRTLGIGGLVLAVGVVVWLMLKPRSVTIWRWRIDLPGWRLSMAQLGISLLDILSAGACLYVLLPADSIPFGAFVLIFILAATAGVISHVPSGLGVFEVVMLAGLQGYVPTEQLAVALVLFRGIYYLLPLIVASILLVWRELSEPRSKQTRASRLRLRRTRCGVFLA